MRSRIIAAAIVVWFFWSAPASLAVVVTQAQRGLGYAPRAAGAGPARLSLGRSEIAASIPVSVGALRVQALLLLRRQPEAKSIVPASAPDAIIAPLGREGAPEVYLTGQRFSLARTAVQLGSALAQERAGPDSVKKISSRLDRVFDQRGQSVDPVTDVSAPDPGAGGAFDSPPSGAVLLERAGKSGVSAGAIGQAIARSQTAAEAAENLQTLGLLSPGEFKPDDAGTALDWIYALYRLWFEVAPEMPSPWAIDANWPLPALRVVRDGVEYFIHGVAHGQIRPAQRSPVMALVKELRRGQLPLYSEENFPFGYRYTWGREILISGVGNGLPAGIRDAGRAFAGSAWRAILARAWDLLLAPGSLIAALVWLAFNPASLAIWLILLPLALFNFLVMTAFLPVLRLRVLQTAWRAQNEFQAMDMAHHLRQVVDARLWPGTPLEQVRRSELPMPLNAQAAQETGRGLDSQRSAAFAEQVRRDSQAAGHGRVHILAGMEHAHEVAWHLQQDEGPKGGGGGGPAPA